MHMKLAPILYQNTYMYSHCNQPLIVDDQKHTFQFPGEAASDPGTPQSDSPPETPPTATTTPITSDPTTSTPNPSPDDPMLKQRRPSRFEVTKVESPSKNESTVTLQIDPVEVRCSVLAYGDVVVKMSRDL